MEQIPDEYFDDEESIQLITKKLQQIHDGESKVNGGQIIENLNREFSSHEEVTDIFKDILRKSFDLYIYFPEKSEMFDEHDHND